jgi:hypothetical protein
MESCRYDCDPDGDILLVLRNPDTPFAVWNHDAEPLAFMPSPRPVNDEIEDEPELGFMKGPIRDQPESVPTELASADGPKLVENAPQPEETRHGEPILVEMRVSSRHLMLASPYYKRMLNGDWKECNVLQSHGCLRMECSDWDIGAVQILMDIIHGQTLKVPKVISLEMLAKIAVLVDYYQCLGVVHFFSSTWIEKLQPTLPLVYSRDLILWIWVSWIFQHSEMLWKATGVAVDNSTGPIQTMGLPIPQRIIRKSV